MVFLTDDIPNLPGFLAEVRRAESGRFAAHVEVHMEATKLGESPDEALLSALGAIAERLNDPKRRAPRIATTGEAGQAAHYDHRPEQAA